jgi:hypothetical protein
MRSPQPSHERLPEYSPRHRQGASRGKVRCCKRTRMARVASTLFMGCLSLDNTQQIRIRAKLRLPGAERNHYSRPRVPQLSRQVRRKSICGKRRSRHEKILGSVQTPVTYRWAASALRCAEIARVPARVGWIDAPRYTCVRSRTHAPGSRKCAMRVFIMIASQNRYVRTVAEQTSHVGLAS